MNLDDVKIGMRVVIKPSSFGTQSKECTGTIVNHCNRKKYVYVLKDGYKLPQMIRYERLTAIGDDDVREWSI